MKITPRAIAFYTNKTVKKLRGRRLNDFYQGKSVLHFVYKGGKFFLKRGPHTAYLVLKRELLKETHVHFPNGLVSGADIEAIDAWYRHHGKHVAIVIPSYNDFELIKDCLKSVEKTVPADRYKAIVVDDYCTKESRQQLATLQTDNVHVIFRNQNGGFAKAVNTGLKYARQKYSRSDVVLLNSDTVAHKSWLAALQHGAYQFDRSVGIVGPKLLYPDGRIQSGGSHRNTELPEWFDHYYRFQPADYGPANVAQYCIGVTGACMYIKATTLNAIGLLDDGFQFAFEDMDYCIRAWQKGMRTLYYPAATLTHVESASRSKNKTMGPKEKASIKYFWEKWGDWFDKRNVLSKDGKIRIIYVLQTTGISGGIRVVFEHLNHLQDRGFDVQLWSLDRHPTWTELKTPSRSFKNYGQLIKALEKEEAIKVATWWETALPVWLSSVVNGIPAWIVQEIESSFYPDNPELQKSVVSCYRKEFNNITSASYTLNEIRSLGLDASLIPCGYEEEVFRPLNDINRDSNTLLALGRTFFQKNFKHTFESWKSLGDKRPNMLLYGSEPDIAKWDKRITYVTKPTDQKVNELYNQATIFVQTSYHEGFCLPVIQAMAAGTPVICTDAHGNQGFSHDGKNCLMVDTDDIEGLAKAIERLMNDSKLRAKLTKAGLQTAKHYTWTVVTDQLEAYYKHIAKQVNHDYIKKVLKKY